MRFLGPITSGKITAVATVAVLVGVYSTGGGKMFSSGPLSAEHRGKDKLGGVSSHAEIAGNCGACHAPAWSKETMASRCLDCHANVRTQLDEERAMHGRVPNGRDCRRCHSEHKGAHAALTNLAEFDHQWTDFKLTGKHQELDCRSCHKNDAAFDDHRGKSDTCVSCHADTHHKGKFGGNCAECHKTTAWTGAVFDHRRTTQACVSCHADTHHKGKFGTNCVRCHTTETFKGSTFKHTFPINHGSRRRENSCSTCHKDEQNYKAYTCYGCHEHQPAKIERIHARRRVANLQDCAGCHKRGKERRGEADVDMIDRWLAVEEAVGLDDGKTDDMSHFLVSCPTKKPR